MTNASPTESLPATNWTPIYLLVLLWELVLLVALNQWPQAGPLHSLLPSLGLEHLMKQP